MHFLLNEIQMVILNVCPENGSGQCYLEVICVYCVCLSVCAYMGVFTCVFIYVYVCIYMFL